MMSEEPIGTVAALWRFPVKSMCGELLEHVEISSRGLAGDRAYALIDVETGKVVSAKSLHRFPGMLHCSASFLEPPLPDREPPPVQIALPDGTAVSSESEGADRVLSGFFAREVRLARAAPTDFTIEQYHPDIENADPRGYRDVVVEQKLGAALFAELGLPPAVEVGAFFDLFPVSVLTTSTLARLHELRPESRFDQRRFRMNIIIQTPDDGFVENGWIGCSLGTGNGVRLRLALPDPRCVMTTIAQEELPHDPEILRTLVRHNRIEVGSDGASLPCAGVYAVVDGDGNVKTGDRVLLH